MTWPHVSVVIPAFDAAPWIRETLASVVAQTYPKDRLEIVVVDDHSSDDTGQIASRVLSSSEIKHVVLRNPSPVGPSASRNRGWQQASGQWIQFLDADDLIDPSKIAVQAPAAADADDQVAVVFSRWARLCLGGMKWSLESPEIEPSIGADPIADLLRADSFIATGSQLFRRTWLEHVGGYVETYRFIEDVDLLLRIAFAKGQIRLVPSATPLFFYRQHSDSLARSNARGFIDGCVRNANVAERHWRATGDLTTERAELLASIYFEGARYMAEHDSEEFAALVDRIEHLQPGFVPPHPKRLRWLARLCGYPRAEMLAVRFRQLKRASGLSQSAPQ